MEAEDRQIAAPAEGALLTPGPGQSDPAPGPGLDPQTLVPRQPVPELIAIDQVDLEPRFQVRPLGDLSLLATDLARLGQVFPIDVRVNPPNRYQVVCGYRRGAAPPFLFSRLGPAWGAPNHTHAAPPPRCFCCAAR